MPQWIRQAAVIPILDGSICMVTSSNRKRWVIPKGSIEPGFTAGETGLQEAWEEAGLTGNLSPEPIGSYVYEKNQSVYHVIVFVLEVIDEHEDYPEKYLRERKWFSVFEAQERIQEEGLKLLLNSLKPLVTK